MSNPEPGRTFLGFLLAVALATVTATGALALPEDRDQPIHITADQAVRDEKQGFTVYQGNVRMTQGSMAIEADKVTIFHVAEDADRIVAEGEPARLQQQPEPDKGLVKARARTIEYFKAEDRVRLSTDAQIEQDGSIVTGKTIDYFITEQVVKADSDQASDSSRVVVVIPPQATQDKPAATESEQRGTPDSE